MKGGQSVDPEWVKLVGENEEKKEEEEEERREREKWQEMICYQTRSSHHSNAATTIGSTRNQCNSPLVWAKDRYSTVF